MELKKSVIQNEEGQTTLEYVLVLAIVVMAYVGVVQWFTGFNLFQKIYKPIHEDFKYAYQYGHPEARGYEDDQGPKMHPRITEDENFRIFLYPGSGQ